MGNGAGTASARAAAWLGIGVMAAVDEITFHQLLAWHHFYDRSTPAIGLFADGLLHAAELLALGTGFVLMMRLRATSELVREWAWAGFLWGAGGFQVLDGIIIHKLLRLHQIRYGVPIWPYDVTWILFGLLLLAAGFWMARLAKQKEAQSVVA